MWMRALQECPLISDKDADEGAVKGTLGNRQYYSPALLLDWAPQIPEPRRTEISNRKSAPFCVAPQSATQNLDLQRKCNETICVALALLMLSFQPCLRHHITQRTIQSETSSYPLPCTTTTLYSSLLPSTRPEYDTTCGNRPLAPSSCHYSSALDSRSPVGTTNTGQAACAKMDCEVEPISAPVKPPPPRVPTTTRSTAVENSVSNAAGFPSKA